MNNDNLIFLDFDGVLFDTIKEAYCNTLITIGRSHSIEEINFETEHYRIFRKYRYLITSAWTYFYLSKSIDEYLKDNIEIERRYAWHLQHMNETEHKAFEDNFFLTRKHLKECDYEHWLLLNTPYPFCDDIKQTVKDHTRNFFVITTKDKETVAKLFHVFNILFDASQIIGNKVYKQHRTKKKIIESIAQIHNAEHIIFIDDSREHLERCKDIQGMQIFQPDWGYTGPHDKTATKTEILLAVNTLLRR